MDYVILGIVAVVVIVLGFLLFRWLLAKPEVFGGDDEEEDNDDKPDTYL